MARSDPAASVTVTLEGFERELTMTVAILGLDLGKDICSIVGLDGNGAVVLRRRLRRKTLIRFTADLPACVVAMESCCGAHHIGRIFAD